MRQKNLALEVLRRSKESKVIGLDQKKVSIGHIGWDAFLDPMFFCVVAVHPAARPKAVDRQRRRESQTENGNRAEPLQIPLTLHP